MKSSGHILFILLIIITSCKEDKKAAPESEEQQERPNIVLLVGDDQGYPYFGFMGADYIETPNMDAIAASGTLYTNGYVPENHCRPSLQTLMTGTLPIDYSAQVETLIDNELSNDRTIPIQDIDEWKRQFRFNAMKHFQTLPRLLSEYGYRSFQGGKWWEFNYQNGGFDEGMTKGWTKEEEGNNEWFQKFMGGEGTELARATMQPVYDFVDSNSDQPFFIWYAPELPHYPFDAPDKYYNLYKDKDMTESAKRYYANCTWFDDGVGELKRYLKEKGELDNTIFVYVNDNGWEQAPNQEFRSDSLRWHNGGDKGKLSMYDQSFRTPIIFSWKDKIQVKKDSTSLIHSADIPATILDLIDAEIPKDYFGKSYKTNIEGNRSISRTEIIGNISQMRSEEDMLGKKVEGYWIRSGQWFYSWNLTTETERLFDIVNDPNSDHNLIEDHPEIASKLQLQLSEWKASKGR